MTGMRARIGASQTGATADAVVDALDSVRPVIRVGRHVSPPARTAAVGLLSMLARTHPHAVLDCDGPLVPNAWGIDDAADATAVLAGVTVEPTRGFDRDVVFGVGCDTPADFHIGGDDWTTVLSRSAAAETAASHGYGLHAAAAYAAAQLLGELLTSFGFAHVPTQATFVWNLVDYRLRAAPDTSASTSSRAPSLLVCGAGSVGSSAVALLASGTPGMATIIDPDTFDVSRNPYRYPAATSVTSGPKSLWLADVLRRNGWQASSVEGSVADWVAAASDPSFDGLLLSSVDTVDARADVADVLARTTLTAGVAGLAFHVQREYPADDAACPFCQFVDVGRPSSQVQVWADHTGIPLRRIGELIGGAPLTADDVAYAVSAGRMSPETGEALVGRRLVDLVGRIYADAQVPDTAGGVVTVSAPFVSWLAGVVLAAEVNKPAEGLPMLDRRVDLDLSGVPAGVTRRIASDPTGRCLCRSPVRRRWARALSGEAGSAAMT